jgi:hypothetical protein
MSAWPRLTIGTKISRLQGAFARCLGVACHGPMCLSAGITVGLGRLTSLGDWQRWLPEWLPGLAASTRPGYENVALRSPSSSAVTRPAGLAADHTGRSAASPAGAWLPQPTSRMVAVERGRDAKYPPDLASPTPCCAAEYGRTEQADLVASTPSQVRSCSGLTSAIQCALWVLRLWRRVLGGGRREVGRPHPPHHPPDFRLARPQWATLTGELA